MMQKLIVGSIKSNVGHLEASAALISIVLNLRLEKFQLLLTEGLDQDC